MRGTSLAALPLTRRPTVSVVIPCHNYARFLPAAVESVVAQREVELELIVIDDCSSDGSADVADALAERDERVHVRRHAHNHGHIATYNEGLDAATGDYIVLLSADDLLAPGSLARAVALLEAHPDVGFAYGRAVTFTSVAPPVATGDGRRWRVWHGHDWVRARCREGWNVIWSPEVVMRASLQRAIGPYRSDLPRSADFEMWLRAASVSGVGRIDDADQAFYRIHRNSMSNTIHADWNFQLRAIHDAFTSLPRSGVLADASELYTQACRALAVRTLRAICRNYHHPSVHDAHALDAMAFAHSIFPDAPRLIQWRSLQWRRRLLRHWPVWARRALKALSYLESGIYWRWLHWTEST